jgi:hypothetical protein
MRDERLMRDEEAKIENSQRLGPGSRQRSLEEGGGGSSAVGSRQQYARYSTGTGTVLTDCLYWQSTDVGVLMSAVLALGQHVR